MPYFLQYITNIPHSGLTGDVKAHSILWDSYIDGHSGQPNAELISNSKHIPLNTDTPTRVPNTALQQTFSPDITTVSNTIYNRTSWTTQHTLSSDHLSITITINIHHDYRLRKTTNVHELQKNRLDTIYGRHTILSDHHTTNIHTANIICINILLMADKHTIPKGKIHNNYMLLPDHILGKITQRNNMKRANTCEPTQTFKWEDNYRHTQTNKTDGRSI